MSHGFSPTEYEVIGKTYYKQKKYQKALEAFTSGIDASVIPTISLYDYRAATHEKLADFNAAVKDGRAAIRLNKRDVRGYLRTGSVLQKLNKLGTAINIYKYGMKNVPVDNKDFQLLQQLHNKLTRKLSPAKAVDPFSVLPVELVEMILGYLSFKNVVNCLRVNKGWKNYLIKRPKLWHSLDLSGATKPVSRVFIRNAVRYAEAAVTSLTVHRFQHTDVLRNIATSCKNLHTLEILSLPLMLSDTLVEVAQCATNLRSLVIHTNISAETAAQILRYRPMLERIELWSVTQSPIVICRGPFPNLHTVRLKAESYSPFTLEMFTPALLKNMPSLLTLELTDWNLSPFYPVGGSFVPPLRDLSLRNVTFDHFPVIPNTVTRLFLQPKRTFTLSSIRNANINNTNRAFSLALKSRTERLEHLALMEFSDWSPEWLVTLLDFEEVDGESKRMENTTNLKSLALSGQLEYPMRLFGLEGLCNSSRMITSSLTSLDVSTMVCTDDDIETLVTLAPNLEVVNVSSTRITGASIKMLADGLPHLRKLKANNCPNISSRDAVAYAERQGIVVSCIMTDSSSGKKVRHALF